MNEKIYLGSNLALNIKQRLTISFAFVPALREKDVLRGNVPGRNPERQPTEEESISTATCTLTTKLIPRDTLTKYLIKSDETDEKGSHSGLIAASTNSRNSKSMLLQRCTH